MFINGVNKNQWKWMIQVQARHYNLFWFFRFFAFFYCIFNICITYSRNILIRGYSLIIFYVRSSISISADPVFMLTYFLHPYNYFYTTTSFLDHVTNKIDEYIVNSKYRPKWRFFPHNSITSGNIWYERCGWTSLPCRWIPKVSDIICSK